MLYCWSVIVVMVPLQIPAGVQSHHRIRLSGRGIPKLNHYGNGDHYVNIKIATPK